MPNTSFGEQLMQSATGGILGIGLGTISGQIGGKQQVSLMKHQTSQQKQLMDYQNMKQMEMWRNTSYGPQVEQMKMAGINPALLYGMSGGGGQSTGSGMPGTSVPQRGNVGGEGMAMTAAQLGLLKAQRENIEADTKNKQADIPVKGAQVPKIQAETKGQELSNTFMDKSMKDRLDQINTDAIIAIQKLSQEEGKTLEEKRTRTSRVELVMAQAAGQIMQNILTGAQTQNVKQDTVNKIQQVVESEIKIKMWIQQNMREWDELSLQERETRVKELIGGVIEDQAVWQTILGGLDKLLQMGTGMGRGGHTPIKGFKF